MSTLEGKVAFVTGASRGIGAAVARQLSTAGVSVGLASRSGDDLGLDSAIGLRCDVTDPAQVSSAVAEVAAATDGGLDGLVNNAGIVVSAPVEFVPLEELRRPYGPPAHVWFD